MKPKRSLLLCNDVKSAWYNEQRLLFNVNVARGMIECHYWRIKCISVTSCIYGSATWWKGMIWLCLCNNEFHAASILFSVCSNLFSFSTRFGKWRLLSILFFIIVMTPSLNVPKTFANNFWVSVLLETSHWIVKSNGLLLDTGQGRCWLQCPHA